MSTSTGLFWFAALILSVLMGIAWWKWGRKPKTETKVEVEAPPLPEELPPAAEMVVLVETSVDEGPTVSIPRKKREKKKDRNRQRRGANRGNGHQSHVQRNQSMSVGVTQRRRPQHKGG